MTCRRGLTLVDVVTCLVLIVLGLGAVAPLWARTREPAWRVQCASHLRQIGQAMMLYAMNHGGAFPRTTYDATTTTVTQYTGAEADDPFVPGGPQPNDVTAALFLLLRTQDITTDVFVCPRTTREPLDVGGHVANNAKWSNLASEEQLGYSYANPYPGVEAEQGGYALDTATLPPTFVVAADMNPGDAAMLNLTASSQASEMRAGNTRNHGRDGQNVLFADWHVEFMGTPFVGVAQDNVYTYGPSGPSGGGAGLVGPPAGRGDSVLLPVATVTPGMRAQSQPGRNYWYLLGVVAIALLVGYKMTRRADRRLAAGASSEE